MGLAKLGQGCYFRPIQLIRRTYGINPYHGYDSVDDQPFDMVLSPPSSEI